MKMFAGLDVGGKTTAICIVDEAAKIVWRGMADTHPDAIAARLKVFQEKARQGWHRERAVRAASASVASSSVEGRRTNTLRAS